MEIKTDDYSVVYDPATQTVKFRGSLRLSGAEEYADITQLLSDVAEQAPEKINLDLQGLEFLNSSGINMFSKFVIKVRQLGNTGIQIQGSKKIPWQGKSLKNFQRLMPNLQLDLQ
ncbi:MAG TPA: hypothetical protein V6C84_16010 [Coleofasciculaceae cyanobacterium]|jgi:hypothetical protein